MQGRSGVLATGFVALIILCSMPALAQSEKDPTLNPKMQSVQEHQLLKELRKVEGRVTIPDSKAGILEQPQGREYRTFHERILRWLGAIVIVGTLVALGLFYLVRGPIPMERPPSGIRIKRFTPLERLTHWLTATSFIVLAITGLNYVFGKRLLMPLVGPEAFSTWSLWAKYLHNSFAWPFMLGLLLMAVLWLRDNVPDRYDLEWLKQFGGFLSNRHPPARRFNAGQKLIFWSVIFGGLALTASGSVLLFPHVADIGGIQIAQYVHAVSGAVMTAIMLAHIYIGTVGMIGALDAMVSGEVDLEWAKEHHRVWVEEEQARLPEGQQLRNGTVLAEY
jgi:formate dehydrogenase subunit gamma